MRRFPIEQSSTEFYTSHSGLALVGPAINRYTRLKKTLRGIFKRHGIPNIDLIRAAVGRLCLGKSDFYVFENMRLDRYFKKALGIKQMPSASHLRQHFDAPIASGRSESCRMGLSPTGIAPPSDGVPYGARQSRAWQFDSE